MKIDRLLALTIHLLNHENATAPQLARKFEVSERTIKRDIESLNLAGIPVISMTGRNGGYAISEQFGIEKSLANSADLQNILTALKSLNSAIDDEKIEATLDKLKISSQTKSSNLTDSPVFVDFSIVKENESLSNLTKLMKQAISQKVAVKFTYHGHAEKIRKIYPLALSYRWYAWYLLAFEPALHGDRIFKLARMQEAQLTAETFIHPVENLDELLEQTWQRDARKTLEIKLFCQAQTRSDIEEYFRPEILETHENGDFICTFTLIEKERLWFALLLSFGDKVRVLDPPEVSRKLTKTAQNILENYKQ